MHLKLALEAAEQRLAAAQQAVAAAETELSSTQQQLLAAQQEQEDSEAAAAEVAAAASEVRTCQVLLGEQKAAAIAAIATAARLQTELAAKQQLARGMAAAYAKGGSGGGSCAGAQAALRSEQQRLATAAAALAQRLAAAAEACAAAEECAAAADDALALCLLEAPSQSEAVGLLERRRAELAACAAALEAWQSQHAEQAGHLTALQDEVHRRSGELAAAQQAAEAAAAASAAQAAAAEQLAGQQQQLEQQLASLMLEVPELQAVLSDSSSAGSDKQHAPCLGASGGGGCDKETQAAVRHLRQACAELEQRRGRLLAERRRCSAANLPLSEQQRHREQAQRLTACRSQLETLQQAAARLQEGIHASNVQVLAVNETVFCRIAATFQSLTAAALPSLRLRLCKVGKEVHEGVRLQFAHHSKEAAGGGGHTSGDGGSGDCVWRTGLDALSGGQRTLVSLALIVAAAPAGATSSLLLMDEVDGQLDESNQALVARLFQALVGDDTAAGTAPPACRQVLCVSHNAAFQQLCQHVVHLTRGPGGTPGGLVAMKGGDGSSAGGTATRGKERRGM
ncbi:hypothetical protein D9Q98_003086 [Chlorella vulgaris]|uniref:RecF/RecN/SMC N-terminal domain-containing protein n=1 Tax=Chlorella vulgaris TaxID=3077 RepID=A0A9D4TUI4_CHLVU|nr:hypothetical protein D9Q98_003086 [Chlorella vulgaris]